MFTPIVSADQLPQVGVTCEKTTLDFKVTPNTDAFEVAKDVAAFANAAGGTLLLGGSTTGEVVSAYVPLTAADASAAQRFYEQSVRDRCRPGPLTAVEHIPRDGGVVVAINIWPSLGQPVGAEFKKVGNQQGSWPQGVYLYPVRVGSHTRPILPEQMHMFVDAKFRRNAIALRGCEGQRIILFGYDKTGAWLEAFTVATVDEFANLLSLRFDGKDDSRNISLPIDLLESVWRDADGWKARVPGHIAPVNWFKDVGAEISKNGMIFHRFEPPQSYRDREYRVRVTDFPHPRSLRQGALRAIRSLRLRLTR